MAEASSRIKINSNEDFEKELCKAGSGGVGEAFPPQKTLKCLCGVSDVALLLVFVLQYTWFVINSSCSRCNLVPIKSGSGLGTRLTHVHVCGIHHCHSYVIISVLGAEITRGGQSH